MFFIYPKGSKNHAKWVLSSSETTVRKLYHLRIGGCQLQTTAMHPFMVEGKGFVAAQDLELGDRVIGIQAKGRIQVNALEAIEVVYYEEPQKVYNFEVAEWHTYFIEEQGFLVHNGRKCVRKKPSKVTKKPSANVPKRLHVKGNKERYVVKRGKGKSGRTVNPKKNVSKRTIDKKYKRPTYFRKKVRDEVWELAKGKKGIVRDPLTKNVMEKNQPWHMGHKPGYEFRKHQDSAQQRGISRKRFLDEHNTPSHYHPELPSSNVSHKGEDKTKKYLGF